jgi:hypothetical protein
VTEVAEGILVAAHSPKAINEDFNIAIKRGHSVYDVAKLVWQSMKNVGDRDTNNLKFTKTCDVPWNGVYQVGCTIDGITAKSNIYGPVNNGNNQSPILRIGPYGTENLCSKLGGKVSVYRQRPNEDTMTDITQYLTNTTNTRPYNKKDPLFLDDYKADC